MSFYKSAIIFHAWSARNHADMFTGRYWYVKYFISNKHSALRLIFDMKLKFLSIEREKFLSRS